MATATTGPRSVPEIRDAIALFEKWERAINDPASAQGFQQAIETLDDYLECEPDSPHKAFIQNLRISNTRRLLQLLARVEKKDFSVWFEYVVVVAAVVDREAESVMAAQPELRADYEAFIGVWKEALTDSSVRRSEA